MHEHVCVHVDEPRQHRCIRQVHHFNTRRRVTAGCNGYNLVFFDQNEQVFQRLLAPAINQFGSTNRNQRRRLHSEYYRFSREVAPTHFCYEEVTDAAELACPRNYD